MRAAVVTGPGRVEIRDVPDPEPGVGQVRVRLEGCGVCASNLPPWEGRPWFRYPLEPGEPGHEGWGRIDRLGPGVARLREGQRVALLSGRAYADYDLAAAGAVVPLPEVLDGSPFPGEPLGCAMNIFHRSAIRPGETVAIVGVGFLGTLLTRLATLAGARVIALSRCPGSLERARALGASLVVPAGDHTAAVERVREWTGGMLCDVVIEASGKQEPLDLAGELTRERGRLVIAGYHQDGLRRVNLQLWNWRGLDVINAHERDPRAYVRGMRAAVRAVVSGLAAADRLYTHIFPLERLGEALSTAAERPEGFVKALVLTG